ncbi:glycolipid transfer protein-like isoform X2 [Tubulanus polymorphus]|uniref:glycolipid transfer protein-like isoform X2 n=1 Tax=Tubulanus polymorphus TaxID=672921 RepID=UPI003DA1F022
MSFFRGIAYPNIDEDNDIPVVEFLSACDAIPIVFDSLGRLFKPLKSDVANNINILRKAVEKDSEQLKTVKSLLAKDIRNNATKQDPSVTLSLCWLNRSCMYIYVMLALFVENEQKKRKSPPEETSTTFHEFARQAYEQTLKKHHGTPAKLLFKAISFAINHDVFVRILLNGATDEVVSRV